MRIAFITHYTALYGANRSLLNLIDGLRLWGVKAHVIAPGTGDLTEELKRRDIPHAIIPFALWMTDWASIRDAVHRAGENCAAVPSVLSVLRLWKIDVVYTNSSVTPIGALAAACCWRPHIWHVREFGAEDYGLHLDWGRRVFRTGILSSSAVIAVSRALRNKLFGDARRNTHVVYNGIAWAEQFDLFRERAARARGQGEGYTFAIVGLVHPSKGQMMAIEALGLLKQQHPTTRLLIIGGKGDREYTEKCEQLAQSLGIAPNVEFWGYRSDPYEAYFAADAVLMCSRYEAMGRVTVEGMSACRPVIGYNSTGTSELIDHGQTGLLFNGDAEELSQCMRMLIEQPKLGRELGLNAWQVARERFCIQNYAKQICQIVHAAARRPVAA